MFNNMLLILWNYSWLVFSFAFNQLSIIPLFWHLENHLHWRLCHFCNSLTRWQVLDSDFCCASRHRLKFELQTHWWLCFDTLCDDFPNPYAGKKSHSNGRRCIHCRFHSLCVRSSNNSVNPTTKFVNPTKSNDRIL